MVDPIIIQLNSNPILLVLLVFSSQYYSAEAQSAIQPASPFAAASPVVWDVSSMGVIIGALIATLLLVFVFVMFLRRFTHSHSYVAESKCEGSKGIHPQLLQTFPLLLYSSITKHLKEGPLQCAVCLADFNHGDTLRLLPQCNHVFHPPCIDAWLSSHFTCPVCRANLNHHHHSLHFAISGDSESGERISRGCGSEEEGKRNGDVEDKGERESALKPKLLLRSNSTGHSVVDRYTLRLAEDVNKCIMMQRSASYNIVGGSSMRGMCWSDSEGSSR